MPVIERLQRIAAYRFGPTVPISTTSNGGYPRYSVAQMLIALTLPIFAVSLLFMAFASDKRPLPRWRHPFVAASIFFFQIAEAAGDLLCFRRPRPFIRSFKQELASKGVRL
jgi:hypothetical protein